MTPPTYVFKQSLRDTMTSCVPGVHIIITDGAAGCYGITMTAVTSATDELPTMMLCTNREVGIIPILLANRDLCISTLSHKQQDIVEHSARMTSLSPEERFTYHVWSRGQNGQLEVEGTLAQLHGSIIVQKEMGTHFILFA